MNCVIDASVAVKWYVPEVFEQEATRLRENRRHLSRAGTHLA